MRWLDAATGTRRPVGTADTAVEGLEGRGVAQPRPHVLAGISSGGESVTERGVAGGPPRVSFRPVPAALRASEKATNSAARERIRSPWTLS